MTLTKKRIAVLLGGPSSERAVSLRSGAAVAGALRGLGANVSEITVDRDLSWARAVEKLRPRCVFIALHGKFGEDGTVQSILDFLKIPYAGSGHASSAAAMDKIFSKRIFESRGIPTPAWTSVRRGERIKNAPAFPLVVKPSDEGSAVGVSLAGNRAQLAKALETAFKYSETALIEKYIPGTEITVGIIDGKALPVVEIVPKGEFYDYRSKYSPGMSEHIIPARVTPAQSARASKIALSAFEALGCRDFARIDMKVSPDGRIYVFEANTIPGLTATSLLPDAARAAGMDFAAMTEKMIMPAIKRGNAKK